MPDSGRCSRCHVPVMVPSGPSMDTTDGVATTLQLARMPFWCANCQHVLCIRCTDSGRDDSPGHGRCPTCGGAVQVAVTLTEQAATQPRRRWWQFW